MYRLRKSREKQWSTPWKKIKKYLWVLEKLCEKSLLTFLKIIFSGYTRKKLWDDILQGLPERVVGEHCRGILGMLSRNCETNTARNSSRNLLKISREISVYFHEEIPAGGHAHRSRTAYFSYMSHLLNNDF